MRTAPIRAVILGLISLSLPACSTHKEAEAHEEHHEIVLTSPVVKDVVYTQQYVCQIHSQRNIEVCAWESGRLQEIQIKEGQVVKQGEVMFTIVPTLYQAKYEAEVAEVKLAQIEYDNTKRLFDDPAKVVSQQEVFLYAAKLAKAQAKLKLAETELGFATVKAPFTGIIDRQEKQQGSMIREGEVLTNLSDNSMMWVYFNVPESRYLEDMASSGRDKESPIVELVLANGNKFPHTGTISSRGGKFNNETGNTRYRADFSNPERLLRHGQTGTVLIHRKVHNAIVIPQRAVFEILDKQYVYVVDEEDVVRQRPITIQHELDDVFVIKCGIGVKEKIVLEGIRQVRVGEKIGEHTFREPADALANQKNHAE